MYTYEIANELGMSRTTFHRRFKQIKNKEEIGQRLGNLWLPEQVILIKQKIKELTKMPESVPECFTL